MHILFLTENFPPEVNAPAVRTFAHCREWVKAGHDVTVITCAPNFPQGKVHSGYKNTLISKETVDGIEVIRVWTYIAANRGFIRRILDQLSYMLTASVGAARVKNVDVVVGTSPQFFAVCAARFVAKIKRIPFIFEVRDLWPASIRAVGALSDGFVYRQLVKLESYLYDRSESIITVTGGQRDHLIERGVDQDKVCVVTNGVDLDVFKPRPPEEGLKQSLGLNNRFVVGYIGTIGMAHNLETILEAAGNPALDQCDVKFHFLFVGSGAHKAALKESAEKRGLSNITFVDAQPHHKVTDYYSILDAAIIHLRDTAEFRRVLPSKMFECMAMGVPVLHGVRGPSAEIVQSSDCGLPFEPEDAEDFVQGLLVLANDQPRLARMRTNGPKRARDFDRKELAADMLEIVAASANRASEIEPLAEHYHVNRKRAPDGER